MYLNETKIVNVEFYGRLKLPVLYYYSEQIRKALELLPEH